MKITYKIKKEIPLKELEKYGFQEKTFSYIRTYPNSSIITDINKRTRIIDEIELNYKDNECISLPYSNKINDLIEANLVGFYINSGTKDIK